MPRIPNVSDYPNKTSEYGEKLCRNCENPVAKGRRHYCSGKCMMQFNRNHDWYWIRKDILKRDRYTCQICKTRTQKRNLDIDHIIPIHWGGNPIDKANLRTLCKECHKAKTKLDREAQKD